jgi:phosphatidylglycerophosphatase A
MIIIGFILFRIFDIFKLIPPAGYIDKNYHGGWGVLLDDLVSAAYAAVILYGVYWLRPGWIGG